MREGMQARIRNCTTGWCRGCGNLPRRYLGIRTYNLSGEGAGRTHCRRHISMEGERESFSAGSTLSLYILLANHKHLTPALDSRFDGDYGRAERLVNKLVAYTCRAIYRSLGARTRFIGNVLFINIYFFQSTRAGRSRTGWSTTVRHRNCISRCITSTITAGRGDKEKERRGVSPRRSYIT